MAPQAGVRWWLSVPIQKVDGDMAQASQHHPQPDVGGGVELPHAETRSNEGRSKQEALKQNVR